MQFYPNFKLGATEEGDNTTNAGPSGSITGNYNETVGGSAVFAVATGVVITVVIVIIAVVLIYFYGLPGGGDKGKSAKSSKKSKKSKKKSGGKSQKSKAASTK